jgi:hypothetical protein
VFGKTFRLLYFALILFAIFFSSRIGSTQEKEKACFSAAERERGGTYGRRLWAAPDPGYDPVLGYNPANGPRKGAPPVDDNGRGDGPSTVLPTKMKSRVPAQLRSFIVLFPATSMTKASWFATK